MKRSGGRAVGRSVAVVFLLVMAVVGRANGQDGPAPPATLGSCVLPDSARVAGVSIAGHRSDLIAALGAPLAEHKELDEDARGRYAYFSLRFAQIVAEVDSATERIQSFRTSDPKVMLGRGTHVGMDVEEVIRALGVDTVPGSNGVLIPICGRRGAPAGHGHVTLTLDRREASPRVVMIEVMDYDR